MKQLLPKMLVIVCILGLVTGCHHQPKSTAQQPPLQAQAPPVTDTTAHPVQMEVIPLEPEKTNTAATTAPAPAVTTPAPAAKPERRKKTTKPQNGTPAPAQATTAPPPAAPGPAPAPAPAAQTPPPQQQPTNTAANATHLTNPASPVIGQLTEGDISGSAQVQEETEKLIRNTESGLAGIQRPLTAQEQETAKQIRKFIEQAREALTAQDAGGAHTLAVKANLLLAELKK